MNNPARASSVLVTQDVAVPGTCSLVTQDVTQFEALAHPGSLSLAKGEHAAAQVTGRNSRVRGPGRRPGVRVA